MTVDEQLQLWIIPREERETTTDRSGARPDAPSERPVRAAIVTMTSTNASSTETVDDDELEMSLRRHPSHRRPIEDQQTGGRL